MSKISSLNKNSSEGIAVVLDDNIENERIGKWIYFLTGSAAISGLLFGYDTGYISSALVLIHNDLGSPLSNFDKSLITAATSLGALIGALVAGSLADLIGRKKVIMVADIIFIIGALLQAVAFSLPQMIVGRWVIGFGVGVASLVTPLYISELAPSHLRGRMVVINVLNITLGQLIAGGIGAGFAHVEHGWRHIIWLSAIPAISQMVLLIWLPETPRYLLRKRKTTDATIVLKRTYPSASPEEIDYKITLIERDVVNPDGLRGFAHFRSALFQLFTIRANLRALVITAGLQALQQLCGFNSLLYFASTIFQFLGFNNPTATSIIISATNFVFTCVAFLLIDRIGRRKILISTVWLMAAGLALAAIGFHFLPLKNTEDTQGPKNATWGAIVVVAMVIYVMAYATGLGNVPWQQNEFFGMRVRGAGTSFSTAANWGSNLVISATFLLLMDAITPTGTFGLYAGWVAVIFIYPETAGFTIEEVQKLLQEDFGVRKSTRWRRELRKLSEEEKIRREHLLREQ